MNQNMIFKTLINDLNDFEKKFAQDAGDESLMNMLGSFFETIKGANFTKEELNEINEKLFSLRQLFADKQNDLKIENSNLLKTKNQLDRYIINSSYKTYKN